MTLAWATVITGIIAAVASVVTGMMTIHNGKKTDRVEVLVNGNMATIKKELDKAHERIATMQIIIEDLHSASEITNSELRQLRGRRRQERERS